MHESSARLYSALVRVGVVACLSLLPVGSAASNPAATVVLPNGETVLIGAEGPSLLAAHDTGRLEALLWQLADEGRLADTAPVLAFIARERPRDAASLAALGTEIAESLGEPELAATIQVVVAREAGSRAPRSRGVEHSDDSIANLEPASGRDGERPSGPQDNPGKSPVQPFNGSPSGGLGDDLLPPGLRIGNVGGGNGDNDGVPVNDDPGPPSVLDPPDDGGMT